MPLPMPMASRYGISEDVSIVLHQCLWGVGVTLMAAVVAAPGEKECVSLSNIDAKNALGYLSSIFTTLSSLPLVVDIYTPTDTDTYEPPKTELS